MPSTANKQREFYTVMLRRPTCELIGRVQDALGRTQTGRKFHRYEVVHIALVELLERLEGKPAGDNN